MRGLTCTMLGKHIRRWKSTGLVPLYAVCLGELPTLSLLLSQKAVPGGHFGSGPLDVFLVAEGTV